MTSISSSPSSSTEKFHRPAGAVLRAHRASWTAGLVAVGIVLSALNLRPVITSVGPMLNEIQSGLGMSSAVAGVLTTLPVMCFAVFGTLSPFVARKIGDTRLMFAAAVLLGVGLLARALTSSAAMFLVASGVALVGGAVGNVMLPTLVKRYFPERIGLMTTVYATALAVGTSVSAAATAPIERVAGGSWHIALGSWVLLAVCAVLPWLALMSHRSDVAVDRRNQRGWSSKQMAHSRLAWLTTVFFGAQSLIAYVVFGWFARILRSDGYSASRAGLVLAFLTVVMVPVAVVLPSMAAHRRSQRGFIVFSSVCYTVGFAGLWIVPTVAGGWLWALFIGLGASSFPLALTLIALRTRSAAATGSLSAFTQGIGYVIAGTGPLLVGVLYSATSSWVPAFVLLFLAIAVQTVSGWRIARPRYVEDELPSVGKETMVSSVDKPAIA